MPTLADRSISPPRYSHSPHALSIMLPDLVAADGHRVSVALGATIRLAERPADVAVFGEQFAGSQPVTLDDVRGYLAAAVRPAAEEFVADHAAAECIDDTAALQTALLAKLNAIAFGCGLEILPPVTAAVTSDSLAADRLAAAAARRQTAALERAADLRKRLADGTANFVGVTDIAELLPTLLQTEPRSAARFFMAAGPNCISLDASPLEAVAMPAAASIGQLRSCRMLTINGQPTLALGGQGGVALQPISGAAPADTFTIDGLNSPRGFNAIGFDAAQRQVVATHGEIGIVRWALDSNEPPQVTPLPGARLLLTLDDRQLLANGGDVVMAAPLPKTIFSDSAAVVALLDLDETIGIVRASGEVMRIDRTTLRPVATFHHPTPIRCAALLRVAGLRLILLGTEAGVIDVVTFMGQTIEHLRPRAGVSLLAAVGPTIAALSADRATLELFDGLRPAGTVNLVARFGHRATDLVPSPGTPGEG